MNIENKSSVDWKDERCKYFCSSCKNNLTTCQIVWGILIAISIILIVVLVPLSYSYVDYDQYALKKNNLDNNVKTDVVYDVGRYYWGVEYTSLTFSRHFKKVVGEFSIFPSSGLEFIINVIFYYRPKREHIGSLYKAFGTNFDGQVVNRANAKIKNVAPQFDIGQYIRERPLITHTLHEELLEELKNIWIDLPEDKFFLAEIQIPLEIKQRDLDAAVQKQRNAEEQNRQQATLVRKETEKLEQEINTNINLIYSTANATKSRMLNEAESQADKTISSADGLGLQNLFEQLNVTDTITKQKYIQYFAFLDTLN